MPQCLLFYAMAFCAAVFALYSVAFAFCAMVFAAHALALVLHAVAFAVCAVWFLFVLQHLHIIVPLRIELQCCVLSCNVAC